ncbi:MAG: FAD-dependent oxidoreductase [Balneolaceae bacterium]
MEADKNICVLGAGITGLSCGISLLKAGFKVTIISKDDPRKQNSDPLYASYFPSASVIPHSIFSSRLIPLFERSQLHFKELHQQEYPGIGINEHYELFNFQHKIPDYAPLISNLKNLESYEEDWHPKHPSIEIKCGWKFDCFFADWSIYFPTVLKEFFDLGGNLEIAIINTDSLIKLPYQYLINCTGAGASELFEDENPLLFRGHLIQVSDAPILKNKSGQRVSYNFSHQEQGSNPTDVYCYPRKDGWILGGSRQKGIIKSGKWIGEESDEPTEMIEGIAAPSRILRMNKEIISGSFGINLDDYPKRMVKIGYRYIRAMKDGLRLEAGEIGDKLLIHNYGHGGAGVTLSWGCAEEVLSILEGKI